MVWFFCSTILTTLFRDILDIRPDMERRGLEGMWRLFHTARATVESHVSKFNHEGEDHNYDRDWRATSIWATFLLHVKVVTNHIHTQPQRSEIIPCS